ncbi:hypothetical protein GW931_01980 [archaeon]|nr:hypothetical protein [archaeon]PJC45263.1 MAG: hypothetical protein CO037_02405 [Candidatus Pacearchaeota archaeon CG_4_9_14_0_2_um_filter_30_8]
MKISKEKREKISEQILFYLFRENPRPIFTSYVAKEIARDEEFTKKMLMELKEKGLLLEISKNKEGIKYKLRLRWKLSPSAYEVYSKKQKESSF